MSATQNAHRSFESNHAPRVAEASRRLEYDQPQLFPIGTAASLLQGCGRRKYDGTVSRGFEIG